VRKTGLACAVVMLVGVSTAVALAQVSGSAPTVAVTASATAIALQPGGPVAPGPTRFAFTRAGKGDVDVSVATLRAGVTVDELRQTLSRSPEAALGLVFIEAGFSLSDTAPSGAVTVTLRPNVTYVAVSTQGSKFGLATFTTTDTANGAQAPAPDATIRMVDYGFRGSATLPRRGVIRVQNRGAAYHFALAFPLRSGVSSKRAGAALRAGSEKAIRRIVAGEPVTVQDLISPGSSNDNEVRFRRAGRYAFVCFFGEHNRLGMYRVFSVR
jgi:hypothetical protein